MDTVSVRMHYIRNMGNYESLKVEGELSSDVRDEESYDDAWNRVYSFVEEKIEQSFELTEAELREIRKAVKAKEGR